VNTSLAATRPHRSKQISDAVAAAPDILDLTVGEPSYRPPVQLLETVAELTAERPEEPSARYNRYAHVRGASELRDAIAGWYACAHGLDIDPESEILVTHGAAEAIWLTVFTLTDPGDEIILPDPCYMLYEPITSSLGRIPVRVPTRAEDGFALDPAAVERAAGPRTRLLIVNSPANPTGAVTERALLGALVATAAEHGFHLLHDEVFDCFAYGAEHVPALALPGGGETVVLANSFSKRFGMTGWRLGWLVGPPALVAEAVKAHTFVTLGVATLIQQAAATALADPQVEREVAVHAKRMRARGLRLLADLSPLGFSCPAPPRGGFYLFARADELAERLDPRDGSRSEAVASFLLQEARVAVVPGPAFGPAGEGYVRFSYAAPQHVVDLAVRRMAAVLRPARGARARG
jgi:aspartate/methionine/tyrosine aminotransferase